MKVTKATLEQRIKDLEHDLSRENSDHIATKEELAHQHSTINEMLIDRALQMQRRKQGYVSMHNKMKEDDVFIVTKEALGFLLNIY